MIKKNQIFPALLALMELAVTALFWIVAGGGALFVTGLMIYLLLPVTGLITPVLTVLLLAAIARASLGTGRRRTLLVLVHLEQAVRLNLPLPRMLRAAAASEKGRTRRRLNSLADLVERGLPLGEALKKSVPEMPLRSLRLIDAAENLGQLPATLAELVREGQTDLGNGLWRDISFHRIYPLLLLAFCGIVVVLLMIFVIPKFEQIYRDFRIRIPQVTASFLRMARSAGPCIFWLLPLLLLAMTGRFVWRIVRGGRVDYGPLATIGGWLAWRLPILHTLAKSRGLADALNVAGAALKRGRPLNDALHQAASLDVNSVLHGRLRRWETAAAEGHSAADAARAAGLPPLVANLLRSAEAAGQLPAALEFLSCYYRGRFSRLAILLEGAMAPLAALIIGGCVAWLALALFMPMITLVNQVSTIAGFGK